MRLEKNNLRLMGKNQEDLEIISAHLQDSIVTIKDMVFLKKNRVFVMIINRFMWEYVETGDLKNNKRTSCAVKFEEVLQVKSKKIDQKNNNKNLICLAVKLSEISNKNYKIKIFFSGDSIITLISESIEVIMQDLGEPWNVKHIPKHKI